MSSSQHSNSFCCLLARTKPHLASAIWECCCRRWEWFHIAEVYLGLPRCRRRHRVSLPFPLIACPPTRTSGALRTTNYWNRTEKMNDLSSLSASFFLLLLALVFPRQYRFDASDQIGHFVKGLGRAVRMDNIWFIFCQCLIFVEVTDSACADPNSTKPKHNRFGQNLSSWTPFTQTYCGWTHSNYRLPVLNNRFVCDKWPISLGEIPQKHLQRRKIHFDGWEMWFSDYWLLEVESCASKWNWNLMVPMSNKKYETIFLHCLIWHIFNAHIHGWREESGKM